MAYQSTKIKEILLYSSVAQAGLVILLFVSGLTSWALFMVMANAISKMILFMVIAEAAKDGKDDLSSLKGLFVKNKTIGLSFTFASLSVIGLPLFMGFVVKMNALEFLFAEQLYLAITAILLASVVEGIYFIRMLLELWSSSEHSFTFPAKMQYILIVLALVLVFFGLTIEPIEALKDGIESTLHGGALWLV